MNQDATCPICSKTIRQSSLERHVNYCLDNQQEPETTATQEPAQTQSKKRNAFSAMGLKLDSNKSNKKQPKLESKKSTLTDKFLESKRLRSSQNLEDQFKPVDISEEKDKEKQKDKVPNIKELKRYATTPLAHRLRPKSLDDFIGQEKLINIIKNIIQADLIPSFLLWGKPGCGKTTLARIIAKSTNYRFVELSGVDSNAKSLKETFIHAENHKKLTNQKTILFLDEIHRYNKAVQDLLLPVIEKGIVTVIGATTENPSFNLNNALLSRLHTFIMDSLSTDSIIKIISRALYDINNIRKTLYNLHYISLDKESYTYIAELSMGDSRSALNVLESINAYLSSDKYSSIEKQGVIKVTKSLLQPLLKSLHFHQFYDRNGDSHYDIISAFHKSIRGNDANAAMFYLVKMLDGGEDPLFIMRRMIVIASEDIGLRDSSVLPFMVSAKAAIEFVGFPEGEIILAHCANKLANSSKSTKSYRALRNAQKLIREQPELLKLPVPIHLRNAPTKLMKEMGYGEEYKYNPNYENGMVKQKYFPDEMENVKFLEDTHLGTRRDDGVDDEDYEIEKAAQEDYNNFKKKFKMELRNDLSNKDVDEKQEYSDDPDCINNFGKSYDEFLDPDSQPDYYEEV
ncbi:unnamed protein product [Candida verbasci]|uniref:UBZ4-type domain-containing protein n=1 Tax=Candida verbasci TaxID=1227364 RepID=A0A9W4TVB0_9ASCO|nr:unnamed protein product [Candida verbasci]